MQVTLFYTDLDIWALGLRSVSAVIKAAGHKTQLIKMTTDKRQFSRENLADAAALIRHSDIIGVSCLARGSDKARQLIESLRSQKKLIVWGGVHASLNPAECADWADIVCRGEGEEVMLELLERLEQGRYWKDIENVAFKANGGLQLNDVRPPIADLDKLPLPDFSFENEYHLTDKGFIQVCIPPVVGQMMFNGSRGCAFHCTYCCNIRLKNLYSRKGRYVRRMSVSRFIEHTQNLRKTFPLGTHFYFLDEDFGARPVEELAQLAEEFPQKVGLPFACLTHPAQVTQQKMDLLTKAGLTLLQMGVESGSERTRREVYDRHVSNTVVMRASQMISRYPRVVSNYFIIIANPYEERDDLKATIRLISELPYGSHIIIYNLVFFPGSALYERAIRERLIEGASDSGYELDFRGGLDYKQHTWKWRNLYLNGLIFLMGGRCTHRRIGMVPRSWIGALLAPRLIEFNENHLSAIRVMISFRFLLSALSYRAARLQNRVIPIRTTVSHLGYCLRMKLSLTRRPE